ncbi:MAG: hypothetical protein ACLUNZ_04780 [Evtepia sp.]
MGLTEENAKANGIVVKAPGRVSHRCQRQVPHRGDRRAGASSS